MRRWRRRERPPRRKTKCSLRCPGGARQGFGDRHQQCFYDGEQVARAGEATVEEGSRYHVMADHVITVGDEVARLHDIVRNLQKENSSGIPTSRVCSVINFLIIPRQVFGSPTITNPSSNIVLKLDTFLSAPKRQAKTMPNSPCIAESIASPTPCEIYFLLSLEITDLH